MTAAELRGLFEEIRVGFDQLVDRAEIVLKALNIQGAAAFQEGEHARASKILAQVQRLLSLRENLRQSKEEWQKIFEEIQLYPPEKNLPPPPARTGSGATPRDRTPRDAFRKPILEALVELGGAAPMREVLDRVEVKMANQLTKYDQELLPSGDDIRWRKAAQWVRYEMVQEGLLARNSPRGIWEITELGRRELLRLQETTRR